MRKQFSINEQWFFLREDTKNSLPPKMRDKSWAEVDFPHVWGEREQDFASPCWYCKEIFVEMEPGERAFLEFQGIAAAAEVFVNGISVCRHENGFSTFYAEIGRLLRRNGRALIAVRVENHVSRGRYPAQPDFPCWGGIYREVRLLKLSSSHFAIGTYGSTGITVTPIVNADGSADVFVRTVVQNPQTNQTLIFRLKGGRDVSVPVAKQGVVFHLERPHLWQGVADPFLYTLEVQLEDVSEILDNVTVRFGIRNFYMDPESGFCLNGLPYPLRGVNRYQDYGDLGWAIGRKEHSDDAKLMRELGVTAVRLAAYQHDQYFYDICDQLGLVVRAEIPFTGEFLPGGQARENILAQLRELILQSYNHPSIICWGIADGMETEIAEPELQETLRALNDLAHEMDGTRLTTLANADTAEPGNLCNFAADVVSYRATGAADAFAARLDALREANGNTCIGLASCSFDMLLPEAAQAEYCEACEAVFAAVEVRPWLWSVFLWNLFDSAQSAGLVSADRSVKREAFYLCRAHWSAEPFVHIYTEEPEYNGKAKSMQFTVYSNCPQVTLSVDGEPLAALDGRAVFRFDNVPLGEWETMLFAQCGEVSHGVTLRRAGAVPPPPPVEEYSPEQFYTSPFGEETPAEPELPVAQVPAEEGAPQDSAAQPEEVRPSQEEYVHNPFMPRAFAPRPGTAPPRQEPARCPSCGAERRTNAAFCHQCGSRF